MLCFLILARFTLDIKLLASGKTESGLGGDGGGRGLRENSMTETVSKHSKINLFCSRGFFFPLRFLEKMYNETKAVFLKETVKPNRTEISLWAGVHRPGWGLGRLWPTIYSGLLQVIPPSKPPLNITCMSLQGSAHTLCKYR